MVTKVGTTLRSSGGVVSYERGTPASIYSSLWYFENQTRLSFRGLVTHLYHVLFGSPVFSPPPHTQSLTLLVGYPWLELLYFNYEIP